VQIDMLKKYKTRDGLEVRIYATDGSPPSCVHGAVLKRGYGWQFRVWSAKGESIIDRIDSEDLVEEPREWIIFEKNGLLSSSISEEYAENNRWTKIKVREVKE
jgi:hypothetical protein